MKAWSRNMKWSTSWILVLEILIQRQQVDVVHRNVIKIILREEKTDVDQRCSIEPKPINLIDDENVMRNLLIDEEFCHVRHKLQKLLETIPKRHNHSEFLLIRIIFGEFLKVLSVSHVIIDRFLRLDVALTVAGI